MTSIREAKTLPSSLTIPATEQMPSLRVFIVVSQQKCHHNSLFRSGVTVPKEAKKEAPSAKDIFGAEPFGKGPSVDPFGMDDFGRLATQNNTGVNSSSVFTDRRINEMREGFSRGISFGEDDFNIESLDPLRF